MTPSDDPAAAIDTFELALGLLPDPTAERGLIEMELGELRTYVGDIDAALTTLAAARSTFTGIGDRVRAAEAAAREARACWWLGEADRADALLVTALDDVDGITASTSAAHVLSVAASHQVMRGEAEAALELAERAMASTPLSWLALDQLAARARFWRGADAELEVLARVVDQLRASKEPQVVVPPLCGLLAAAATLDDLDRAVALGDELLDVAGDAPHNRLREAAEAVRGLLRAGSEATARALVPPDEPVLLRRRLQWRSATGLLAEADEDWERARAHFRDAERGWGDFPHPLEAGHAGVARCARRSGDVAEADAAARRARRWFEVLGARRLLADHFPAFD